MGKRIFLAGATGAVGRALVPMLLEAGHMVHGTTRSAAKAEVLRELGVEPILVDVFDVAALARVVAAARPDLVIHQLTDLPVNLDPALMPDAVVRNARIRNAGTKNLAAAAREAGAGRLIAQSIAWAYAPNPLPHHEDDPLDMAAGGARAITVEGVVALERYVLESPPLEGIVLRYGQLYGPATGRDVPAGDMPLHIDAAAFAALLAIDHGKPGAYNIAEPNTQVATGRAIAELGWRADFRRSST